MYSHREYHIQKNIENIFHMGFYLIIRALSGSSRGVWTPLAPQPPTRRCAHINGIYIDVSL